MTISFILSSYEGVTGDKRALTRHKTVCRTNVVNVAAFGVSVNFRLFDHAKRRKVRHIEAAICGEAEPTVNLMPSKSVLGGSHDLVLRGDLDVKGAVGVAMDGEDVLSFVLQNAPVADFVLDRFGVHDSSLLDVTDHHSS
jgi:hypothetical protein